MAGKVLMIQGASSSVGKSLLVTALCRLFAQRGVRVAPFKAQNMSNNAAVCVDGAEIGRSQAVQATAAGIEPTAEMNPILLKPEGNARSQVIVMGRPWRTLLAGEYYQHKAELWPVVTTALDRLRAAYELVVIEGAGSPAELNLHATDIVNMAVARYARSPVLLVGDIDRGGVFAQLLGTLWLLPPAEQALVRALVVNKFRGDLRLFAEGVRILEARSALPVLGVVPFVPNLYIPEEDSASLDEVAEMPSAGMAEIDIAVIRLPRLANFDDFSPLAAEEGIRLRYVHSCTTLGQPHAVILPGTKSTIADLVWLQEQGLAQAIRDLGAAGTAVAGICGGYQMLGGNILDPQGVESPQPQHLGSGSVASRHHLRAGQGDTSGRSADTGWPRLAGDTARTDDSGLRDPHGAYDQPAAMAGDHSSKRSTHPPAGRSHRCHRPGVGMLPAWPLRQCTLRRAWLTSLGWRAAGQPVGAVAALHAGAGYAGITGWRQPGYAAPGGPSYGPIDPGTRGELTAKGRVPGQEDTMDGAVRVALPGTCGEFVQGTLDGGDCLVSCPIGATVLLKYACGRELAGLCQQMRQRHAPPCRRAWPISVRRKVVAVSACTTQLPRSRGYGSSTADIGATLYALGRAVGRGLAASRGRQACPPGRAERQLALSWPGFMGSSAWPTL